MKNLQFPLVKTRVEDGPEFDLSDPGEREKYFRFKAGKEIKCLREFLEEQTFIAYLLGKKSAGKGTYSQLFREVVSSEQVEHFSVGDMVRSVDEELKDPEKRKDLVRFLEENYRGFVSLQKIMDSLENRSTKKLLPTELILALIKRETERRAKKTLFVDGFPRNMDQISYSLFFRDLIDYRGDPDVFVLIDIPESVIKARMKSRVVCPECHTPRNKRLLPTRDVGRDKETGEFYLKCDNPECEGVRMKEKEGDQMGLEAIRGRLDRDENLLRKGYSLHGIPKILLRNHVPVEKAEQSVNEYEITPEYHYEWNEGKVEKKTRPFVVEDDRGVPSYSLLAPAVVISMIRQMTEIFCPESVWKEE